MYMHLFIAGPALQSVRVFPTVVRDGTVYVQLDAVDAPIRVERKMTRRNPSNTRVIAIIGNGAAGVAAAETLRQEGYDGRILLIGDEDYVAYDRPLLSKNFRVSPQAIQLRSESFLTEEADIELMKSTTVEGVWTIDRKVKLANGKEIKCDKILLATGGTPRRLTVEGGDLQNILQVRNVKDLAQLKELAKPATKVVVVGSSFIGTEVAGSLAKAGAQVYIVGLEEFPLQRVLGARIGRQIADWLNKQPVPVLLRSKRNVVKFHGKNGKVTGVELDNGEVLQADAVVLGVGVKPNTQMVKDFPLLPDGSVEVLDTLQLKDRPNVYAAGDIVTFPYHLTGEKVRVEHWNVAMQQGRTAARNMVTKPIGYRTVPFFWTMILGKSIRYVGYCKDPDEVIVEGNVPDFQFVAYYVKDGQVQAVATAGKDPFACLCASSLDRKALPDAAAVKAGFVGSEAIIDEHNAHLAKGQPKVNEPKSHNQTKNYA